MRYSTLFAALLLASMAASMGAAATDAATATGGENLDKYIGRALVKDNRATKADVSALLPHSCPPFFLRDEYGKIIDPTVEGGSNRPVSTKKTCGATGCHEVDTIVQGYHFQMGADALHPPLALGEEAPLDKSPGFYGKWQCLYQRELAPDTFSDPDEIDMTAFDWVVSCGVCHPGGGPAEFDRAGRRYDITLGEDTSMAMAYEGDYFDSRWQETGVIEADCLTCHMETYDFSERAKQIKKLNFKWAGTIGAGFATIDGTVIDNEFPKLTYNKNLFGPDGKVHLTIRRPTDRNCVSCHSLSSIDKRGSSWHNNYMQDVHTSQGLACIDCHHADIRHNIAKGCSSSMSARDDLDGTMLSCRECHESEEFGAPDYEHPGIPPIHFERISCQACHITKRPLLSARVVDSLSGKALKLPNETDMTPRENLEYGAFWAAVYSHEVEAAAVPVSAEAIYRAKSMGVGPDSEIWAMFDSTEEVEAAKAKNATVDAILSEGSGLADTDFKRKLMLAAIALSSKEAKEAVAGVSCIFQGKGYRLYGDKYQHQIATPQPPRVGNIAEYPVNYAYHEVDGKKMIYPEGYQLGVFWAYDDGEQIKPLFLRDMKAANEFLTADDLRFYVYPPSPRRGGGMSLPAPTDKKFISSVIKKVKSYENDERMRLEVHDDNLDVWPEANTDEEISLVAWSIVKTMKRLSKPELYYVKGESVYKVTVNGDPDPYKMARADLPAVQDGEWFYSAWKYVLKDESDPESGWKVKGILPMRPVDATIEKLKKADVGANPQLAALAQRLPWTISHGVEPGESALGANGCTDCHSMDSNFFFARTVVDPFGPDGQPVTVPMYEKLGFTKGSLSLAAFREGILKEYGFWAVLAVLAAIILHFAIFGAKTGGEKLEPEVPRFNLIERLGHLVLMSSVAYLSVTGFCYLLGAHNPLGELSREIHSVVGYAAGISFVVVALSWAIHMLPAKGDMNWLMHMGGYLGGKGHYPAGKFNAGQKILFWMALCLMAVLVVTGIMMGLNSGERYPMQQVVYTIHDLAGLGVILMLLGHIYLGVAVNPHSLRTLFGGSVSAAWAKKHHPDWKPNK